MASGFAINAELLAVVVAMISGEPQVLTLGEIPTLPAGPLLPGHHSLQAATRAWVEEQTGRKLGYLEQLYTFADLDRGLGSGDRNVSISYLGLTTADNDVFDAESFGRWTPWYQLFPWEDRRTTSFTAGGLLPTALREWGANDSLRRQRTAIAFGLDGQPWQPDLALSRYELLYEIGLVPERPAPDRHTETIPAERMFGDHRRILATAMSRLRAKIEYHPVVFELLPSAFTLRGLQDCVEALVGRAVHTQNFRRLIDQQALVEDTGKLADTGGRPARLYRFRREILQQRLVAGTRLPTTRAK